MQGVPRAVERTAAQVLQDGPTALQDGPTAL